MKNTKISLDSMKKAVICGRENGCNELVLSGGEPTIYPEIIREIIKLAETLEYQKFIIQTNGYGIAQSDDFVIYLDSVAKRKEVCISFSVHGHIPDIHNDLSGNENAFENTINAIEKTSKTYCKIYTNTVINSKNKSHLKDIAHLLQSYNPEIMQFSAMHLKEKTPLSVSFRETVNAIRELKDEVSLDVLRTEGVPYCCLYGMEQCVGESSWPTVLDLYNKEDDYLNDFKQIESGMRKKMKNCNECILNSICMGVWKEHFSEFNEMGLHPIM